MTGNKQQGDHPPAARSATDYGRTFRHAHRRPRTSEGRSRLRLDHTGQCTRLLALTRAGLLRRFFLGFSGAKKALYSVCRRRAAQVDGGSLPRSTATPGDQCLSPTSSSSTSSLSIEIYCTLKYRPIPVPNVTFRRWMSIPEASRARRSTSSQTATWSWQLRARYRGLLSRSRPRPRITLSLDQRRPERYLQLALSGEYTERSSGRNTVPGARPRELRAQAALDSQGGQGRYRQPRSSGLRPWKSVRERPLRLRSG